jgi:hypothetical protein
LRTLLLGRNSIAAIPIGFDRSLPTLQTLSSCPSDLRIPRLHHTAHSPQICMPTVSPR